MRRRKTTHMFAKPANPAPPQTDTRRNPLRVGLCVTAVLLVLALIAAAFWAHSMGNKFNEERTVVDLDGHPGNAQPDMSELVNHRPESNDSEPTEKPTKEDTEAVNVLLLGSDIRPDEADARSDTIMVAHIPADRSSAQIMSLPRDLWVPIPGHGEGRINSAFQLGGAGLTMATVEDLMGITLDHVVMVDFTGFAELTTALGGVTVNNPKEFTTTHGPEVTFAKGEITLKGDEALQYVRERKAFPDSDLTRVENQQRVVRAVMDTLLSSDTITRPDKINDVLDTMLPYLSVDEELTAEQIVSYALEAKDLRGDDISSFTVPNGAPYTTPAGEQVLGLDDAAINDLRTAFDEETVTDYAKKHSD